MSAPDDGGQAFPRSVAMSPAGDEHIAYPGMTLRDWFAGQALQAVATLMTVDGVRNQRGGSITEDDMAESAYVLADAMLLARSKPSSPKATETGEA